MFTVEKEKKREKIIKFHNDIIKQRNSQQTSMKEKKIQNQDRCLGQYTLEGVGQLRQTPA